MYVRYACSLFSSHMSVDCCYEWCHSQHRPAGISVILNTTLKERQPRHVELSLVLYLPLSLLLYTQYSVYAELKLAMERIQANKLADFTTWRGGERREREGGGDALGRQSLGSDNLTLGSSIPRPSCCLHRNGFPSPRSCFLSDLRLRPETEYHNTQRGHARTRGFPILETSLKLLHPVLKA